MRVLIVEDNPELGQLLRAGIEVAGFSADVLDQGGDALEALSHMTYDAVILDLGLPDINGLDLLRTLRGAGDTTPILILTARDGIGDRVKGLDAGADDYVLKPFDMDELRARLRALLRRPSGALSVQLACGNLTFDTVQRQIAVDGRQVPLSKRESELLEYMMQRAGTVIRKQAIEENLYGLEDIGSRNSVEALLSRLRRKLIDAGSTAEFHTIRGVGYMIMALPA